MSVRDGGGIGGVGTLGRRGRFEDSEFALRVYPGALAEGTIYCPVSARKSTTAAEVIERCLERLRLDGECCYVLAEVKEFGGEEWILNPTDCPVQRMMLWPAALWSSAPAGRRGGLPLPAAPEEPGRLHPLRRQPSVLAACDGGAASDDGARTAAAAGGGARRPRRPVPPAGAHGALAARQPALTLPPGAHLHLRREHPHRHQPLPVPAHLQSKVCEDVRQPRPGELEPHIYAVADVAYHAMLQRCRNQCIVISGESGSGKTQSTNFLIHHLTALSQKGFASGVEQIILGAGPVLEAFGNAKTAHNNNSSRFGKFIQVNYRESGTVRGAYVEKYLLEKSRLVYQEHNERNYHVFYYLLAGASDEERSIFHLKKPEEYHYLNQMTKKVLRPNWESYYESEPDCFTVEGEDLKHDFERLQLAMEMVGFLPATRKQIFSLLSAILHLGNIRYKKKTYRDDSIDICNPEVLPTVSELLEVKEEMLFEALTTRKTMTVGERLIMPYKLAEAGTVRDSMAKSLYSALFDWIVFRINHALLNNQDLEESAKIYSIGVLDIFGFEDYESNSFEQFCINLANERLQHYFNQHIFKLEQEEYRAEGISWHNIDYIDNTGCINLISKKPTALLPLLDEECNFPQATNQTLLDKFKRQHEGNRYIEFPAVMEPAFIICHYAGKVKYGVKDFREKNTDHMRPDIVALLKSSKNAFICGLMGIDPPATFRWAVLRAYFRAMVAFREAGRRLGLRRSGAADAVPCAVMKGVDSFSFLRHPVHQRSLEILQMCKEEKYTGVTRRSPRKPLSDLPGSNQVNENSPREGVGWNGRSGRQRRLSSTGSNTDEDGGIFFNSTSSKLLERAHGILMRNKNFKVKPNLPKHLLDVKSLKYLSKLTLHDRITKSLLHLHKKKKPPSISAQFQASLNKLMETLGQSEPYFVKCIRSNAEKQPLRFNDGLVLRQLRYTGMLETVCIRQSGYSVKYTFQDFVRHFRVLLPEGTRAVQEDIRVYLGKVDLDSDGYQVGKTMVFLREVQRQHLQALLHQEVLDRIVTLQRRFRALLERKRFLRMRHATSTIQRRWRVYLSKQEDNHTPREEQAALCLQSSWRGYRERRRFRLWRRAAVLLQQEWRARLRGREQKREEEQQEVAARAIQTAWRRHSAREKYLRLRSATVMLQPLARGYLARQSYRELKVRGLEDEELRANESQQRKRQLQNGQRSPSPGQQEQTARIMGLDLNTWVDQSCIEREKALQRLTNQEEKIKEGGEGEIVGGKARAAESQDGARSPVSSSFATGVVVVRERTRTLDEPGQRTTRAKRESRRMRELEQAKFSLELLKVRATGSGGVSPPCEERRWSAELPRATTPPPRSPQGPDTPDSQSSRGSFELLSADDEILRETLLTDAKELGSPVSSEAPVEMSKTLPEASVVVVSHPRSDIEKKPDTAGPSAHPPKIQNCLPTFYVPSSDSSLATSLRPGDHSVEAATTTRTGIKPLNQSIKERRESQRRPVVVVISMHKETPLDEEETRGTVVHFPRAEAHEKVERTGEPPSAASIIPASSPTSVPPANQFVLEKLERLNEEKEERLRHQQQQREREMMEQIRQQKEVLERQRRHFAQNERDMFEKQRDEALVKIKQGRHAGAAQVESCPSAASARPLVSDRSLTLAPTSRTQSVPGASVAPVDTQVGATPQGQIPAYDRIPPPPATSKAKTGDGRPIADGWAPKLVLEPRETVEGGARGWVPQTAPANQSASINLTEMSGKIFFSPKDRVSFSEFDREKPVIKEKPAAVPNEEPSLISKPSKGMKVRDVGRPGHKKKPRMARTRCDFLTRPPTISTGCESDDYEDDAPISPLSHYAQTLPKQKSFECFSDSDMPSSSSEQKKLQKAMSSGDLVKADTLRKTSQPDGRVRGKMRFWGKTKQGEKKSSREKLICGGDSMDGDYGDTGALLVEGQEYMSPPQSPDQTLDRGTKEYKENKEPSPKVKRRRSVKISNVALEPAQWGNDALQILTCANDYRSMNDFLMKKINDLEAEDGGKKDTMVDVVFKKALKEFRLNIFNSYSTALAIPQDTFKMDDGKSIRYKDLYALFEQILEKTMRLEQRDWSESPVKVWVNTFKIFLDEFMTEYKPMDNTISKVPKPERKKSRKKDADIVEEHNGHIFKATQYSIPTYCEFCSSLIWMMDRACVCKLCRYACHRKCCLRMTTKCSKKYDPELSSRQFGVEVSRLTNEERTVPLVVEKLINYIEMHGLYTEGIYRKSGSTNKIKELKQGLDTDVNSINLDDYNIHVIASVFKQWLRDLPNPLMTFELYDEFLRAMCMQEKKEVIRGVYSIIDQLTRTHLNTLERLFFHLVRIAGQEDTNRMSTNALAIVFAPCILRCPDTIDPLQSVQDIGKTTACVELIIVEQMNKYKARLKDINSLEFAENKAKCRLTLIRRSMPNSTKKGKGQVRRFSYHTPSPPVSPRLPVAADVVIRDGGGEEPGAEPEVPEHQQVAMQQEERVLTEQIESLQKEKEELTFEMLTLEPRASDDETLDSEASIGTADSSENLNVDSEGDFSERCGPVLPTATRPKKSQGRSNRRHNLRRQPDSLDSADSGSTVSSLSPTSRLLPSATSAVAARRFKSSSAGAQGVSGTQPLRSNSTDCPCAAEQDGLFEEGSQFISRGTFNPEKSKQKLKGSKVSPIRHSCDSTAHSREPPDLPQQVLYGSNEFMTLQPPVPLFTSTTTQSCPALAIYCVRLQASGEESPFEGEVDRVKRRLRSAPQLKTEPSSVLQSP
ncbi:hypothetical protein DPEC_G00251900 [Dallia pectoralis]|uniref:Uncharacterized protein n=1 Tax=Dallia pectoralis TaxID=75939 RepID=A0ACC2FTJ2_DALPE|nr:hypothetical protein DPEC_G00251900 [Dallia pectoralis]